MVRRASVRSEQLDYRNEQQFLSAGLMAAPSELVSSTPEVMWQQAPVCCANYWLKILQSSRWFLVATFTVDRVLREPTHQYEG